MTPKKHCLSLTCPERTGGECNFEIAMQTKDNIILGDCFEVMSKMKNKSVDHVFTSPPYNRKRNDKYEHYDDIIEDYFLFLKSAIEESMRLSRGYSFFNLQKNYYNKADVNKIIGYFSEEIVEIIVWQKSNPMPAAAKAITNSWEMFLVLRKDKKSLHSNTTYTKNIITTAVNSAMGKTHKAEMKQDVSDWFIEKFTQEGELILDPFAGTGTTGLSCKKFKRDFLLIEKQSEYIEIIKQRLS